MLQMLYLLQNIEFPDNIERYVIPFASNGDFLPCIFTSKMIEIEMYDLYPTADFIQQRDVLLNPPDYSGKFILSKPPNKDVLENSILYQKYHMDNTYKCFIDSIIDTKCCGGVMIIPFIFWCSQTPSDSELRRRFLAKYYIHTMNIYDGKVCNFKNIKTCSFKFAKRRSIIFEPPSPPSPPSPHQTHCHIYPGDAKFDYTFNRYNNYAYVQKAYL